MMHKLSEKEATHPSSAPHKLAVEDHDLTALIDNSTKPSNPPIKSLATHSKFGDLWKRTWLGKAANQYKTVVTNKLVYLHEFKCFLPYIWPSREPKLFFNYAGVGICLLATRVLFVLVPVQLGAIINALGSADKRFPYSEIALYMLYRWLVNSGLSSLRQYLWEAVDQWSSHAVSSAAYNHVIRLSSDYHDSKSSAKLNSTLCSGASLCSLFRLYLIELVPRSIDALVAFVYLFNVFGFRMAVILIAAAILFFSASAYDLRKKSELNRRHGEAGKQKSAQFFDSMGRWSTVSYFNQLKYEQLRYSRIVNAQLQFYLDIRVHYLLTDVSKGLALEFGRVGACLLAASLIINGELGVGEMSVLLAYWVQFTNSVFWITNIQHRLHSELVGAEDLLDLFKLSPSVPDGDSSFEIGQGGMQFQDICFSYNNHSETLRNINFTVKPGEKIALVGPSGAGKSTLLKIIFRFYDPTSGCLKIDGQDLKTVTTESFREHVGIVPQDATLFNTTIMENVRYSKRAATDEEVMSVCKTAAIHDQILSFKDGYQTVVGENGVRLSGGQMQRLAIARAILKDPKILLLDEPTSSVDTETERQIQSGLQALTQGRTTIAVAHRLSTIADADRILVIDNGSIVEEGPFEDLLRGRGKFFKMWTNQAAPRTISFD